MSWFGRYFECRQNLNMTSNRSKTLRKSGWGKRLQNINKSSKKTSPATNFYVPHMNYPAVFHKSQEVIPSLTWKVTLVTFWITIPNIWNKSQISSHPHLFWTNNLDQSEWIENKNSRLSDMKTGLGKSPLFFGILKIWKKSFFVSVEDVIFHDIPFWVGWVPHIPRNNQFFHH